MAEPGGLAARHRKKDSLVSRSRPTATARAALLLCPFLAVHSAPVSAADDSPQRPGAPRCEIAVVSPVSGFAECVKPRGAPVDPPPPRPPLTPEECAKHADLDLKECPAAVPTEPGS